MKEKIFRAIGDLLKYYILTEANAGENLIQMVN